MTREDELLLREMKDLVNLIRTYGKSIIPNVQLKKITEAVVYYIERTVTLEQRIEELETQKTCEGCKYNSEEYYMSEVCTYCTVNKEYNYEPKEIQ